MPPPSHSVDTEIGEPQKVRLKRKKKTIEPPTLYSSAHNRELPPPTFKNEYVEVRKSPVHGRGLFAKQDLHRNQQVAKYVGDRMTVREYNTKYTPEQRHYYYSARPINTIIDGYRYKTENPSHYMNESEEPNAVLRKFGVVIIQDTKRDKELFLKYPKKYTREYDL